MSRAHFVLAERFGVAALAISPGVGIADGIVPGDEGRRAVFFGIVLLGAFQLRQDGAKHWGRAGRTKVLSETRPVRAGLTLIRVLREGLWLDECLGGTVCHRANG